MSGGQYHCAYRHIDSLADELEEALHRTPAEPPPGARVWSRERRGWMEGEEAADLAARAAEEGRTVADYVRERVGLQVREVRVSAPARLTLEGR